MGVAIPNRMYNMPVARGVEMGPVLPPPPCMSTEEMLEHVEEAERLRKTLTVWHATHHDALMHLRNQMQRADVSHATAIATANMRIQALEVHNLALRDVAVASDEKMAVCNKALGEAMGKYKQYKREFILLKKKHDTPYADNNHPPAGMAGPATA
jgi:hypothetical protein